MLSVNQYFDGNVISIGFTSERGAATAGVMAAGEYTFGTSQDELMQVTSGELLVKLPGSDSWERFPAGSEFSIKAGDSFDLKVAVASSYVCYYG